MSEFSDRPFAAGSLIGLRAFKADTLGRLQGPVYGQVFRPDVNEAECRQQSDRSLSMGMTTWSISYDPGPFYRSMMGAGLPAPEARRLSEEAVEAPKPPPHVLAGLRCGCGFYAYFDGANDYIRADRHERIGAVIEGFGVCTVGNRGFRASKARLVALIMPAKKFPPLRLELIQRNYPGVPVYGSRREAVAEHPLTPPPAPSPETTDDFWTRSAS